MRLKSSAYTEEQGIETEGGELILGHSEAPTILPANEPWRDGILSHSFVAYALTRLKFSSMCCFDWKKVELN